MWPLILWEQYYGTKMDAFLSGCLRCNILGPHAEAQMIFPIEFNDQRPLFILIQKATSDMLWCVGTWHKHFLEKRHFVKNCVALLSIVLSGKWTKYSLDLYQLSHNMIWSRFGQSDFFWMTLFFCCQIQFARWTEFVKTNQTAGLGNIFHSEKLTPSDGNNIPTTNSGSPIIYTKFTHAYICVATLSFHDCFRLATTPRLQDKSFPPPSTFLWLNKNKVTQ